MAWPSKLAGGCSYLFLSFSTSTHNRYGFGGWKSCHASTYELTRAGGGGGGALHKPTNDIGTGHRSRAPPEPTDSHGTRGRSNAAQALSRKTGMGMEVVHFKKPHRKWVWGWTSALPAPIGQQGEEAALHLHTQAKRDLGSEVEYTSTHKHS